MRLKLKFSSVGALALAAVLTGCAAGPHPVVDDAKLRAVHTVTVVYPGQAVYESGTASAPILIPVGSLVVAAITGAVTGGVNASVSKAPATFNDIVSTKLGDTKLNRRFTDGIEADLRSHGYVVTEVDSSAPSLPVFKRDDYTLLHASGPAYRDSDAVLVIRVSPQYFAPGPLNSFRRMVVGEIVMFKGDTHEPLLRQRVYSETFSDPYSYMTFDSLLKDLPHAISGLDDSVMAQVVFFDKALDAAQHKTGDVGTVH
jgi:hypothetical protein